MKAIMGDSPELKFPDPEWVGEVENPAPVVTKDDEDKNRPTSQPTQSNRPDPTESTDPDPTKTRDRPTFSLPSVPSTENGGGGGGGGEGNDDG
jgi:hypothetical protein